MSRWAKIGLIFGILCYLFAIGLVVWWFFIRSHSPMMSKDLAIGVVGLIVTAIGTLSSTISLLADKQNLIIKLIEGQKDVLEKIADGQKKIIDGQKKMTDEQKKMTDEQKKMTEKMAIEHKTIFDILQRIANFLQK